MSEPRPTLVQLIKDYKATRPVKGRLWSTAESIRANGAEHALARALKYLPGIGTTYEGEYYRRTNEGRVLVTTPPQEAAEIDRQVSTETIAEKIQAIRDTGGSDWDEVSNVAAYLGRGESAHEVIDDLPPPQQV